MRDIGQQTAQAQAVFLVLRVTQGNSKRRPEQAIAHCVPRPSTSAQQVRQARPRVYLVRLFQIPEKVALSTHSALAMQDILAPTDRLAQAVSRASSKHKKEVMHARTAPAAHTRLLSRKMTARAPRVATTRCLRVAVLVHLLVFVRLDLSMYSVYYDGRLNAAFI